MRHAACAAPTSCSHAAHAFWDTGSLAGEAYWFGPVCRARQWVVEDFRLSPNPAMPAGIIDEEKKVRHAKFTAKLEEAITDPAKLGIKLRADNVDIAYPPIVQSGGVYDLRASAQSDERHLQYDVITASIGAALLCKQGRGID